jgi:CcmD family protein
MNAIASNETFIIAAYAVTWLVILGYYARLLVRARRVRAIQEKS